MVPTSDETTADAVLSDDGIYRYVLVRRWSSGPSATFIMLNPSTADGTVDDPTIRRCVGFARAWGCGLLRVVNLYALRSRDPTALWSHHDPVGPHNDHWLRRVTEASDGPVVAEWGTRARRDRVEHVMNLPGTRRVHALGVTAHEAPRHPLYVRRDAALAPWPSDRR